MLCFKRKGNGALEILDFERKYIMRIIRGLLVNTWEEPKVVSFSGYDCLKKMIGGYVEGALVGKNVIVYCDVEGKLKGLPATRQLDNGDPVAGNFVVVAFNKYGEDTSLTDEQIKKYTERFKEIKEIKYLSKKYS